MTRLFSRQFILAAFISATLLGGSAAQTVSVAPVERSLVILVRTTLIALDQANRTGNYGVFRDLASPGFSTVNSEARLAGIFVNLRKQQIDMRAVTIVEPRFAVKPFVDKKNLLRLVGIFDLRPKRIKFDMAFELAGGEWKLVGIAVNPAKPATAGAAPPAKKPEAPLAKSDAPETKSN